MHNLSEELYNERKHNIQPWLAINSEHNSDQQITIRSLLRIKANADISENSYVAADANIFTSRFHLGEGSWIASGAIIRGDIYIDSYCSVNPYAHIAGKVRIGAGCRIASLASIYGFNHGHSRTDLYIKDQPSTSEGVYLGDDVWVGANAVILDGVKIGSHCIVAAGAVVTKSFPPYSIIGGNPAKRIKDRRKYPLASFHLEDQKSGLKYHFDMTFNSLVSCHDGLYIRGWALHPELNSLIVKTKLESTTLSINKERPDVVRTFFQASDDRHNYLKCGFEHTFQLSDNYSIFIETSENLIHIADIILDEMVNEEPK